MHGLKDVGPELFARHEQRRPSWLLFAEQRPYWRTDHPWGGRSKVDVDHLLPGSAYLRWGNEVEYYRELEDEVLRSSLSYRRPFFLESLLSLETGVEYNNSHGNPTRDGATDP